MFPLYLVFAIQVRGMNILFDAIWAWSIDNGEEIGRKNRMDDAKATFWQRFRNYAKNPRIHVWLKNRGTFMMLCTLSAIHLTAAGLVLILNWTQSLPYHPRGAFSLEDSGVAIAVILYIMTWSPVMIYHLSSVKDAYRLSHDLMLGVSYSLPCYMLYSCWRSYDFLQPLRIEIPSFIFMLLAMACLHSASVLLPLLRVLFWKPAEVEPVDLERVSSGRPHRLSPYDVVIRDADGDTPAIIVPHKPMRAEQILEHPHLAQHFEQYAKNAFVWDSILFYHAVNTYRKNVRAEPLSVTEEAQIIFEQYIEPGSPCEMNLTYPVVQRLNRAVTGGNLHAEMFDEAQAEILSLIGSCTYRNFLYTLNPVLKVCYLVPYAKPVVIEPPPIPTIRPTPPDPGGQADHHPRLLFDSSGFPGIDEPSLCVSSSVIEP